MSPSMRIDIRLGRVGKFFGGNPTVGVLVHRFIKIFFKTLNPAKKE